MYRESMEICFILVKICNNLVPWYICNFVDQTIRLSLLQMWQSLSEYCSLDLVVSSTSLSEHCSLDLVVSFTNLSKHCSLDLIVSSTNLS